MLITLWGTMWKSVKIRNYETSIDQLSQNEAMTI